MATQEPQEFKVRWSIGTKNGPPMIPNHPHWTERERTGNCFKVPCFDLEELKSQPRWNADGTAQMVPDYDRREDGSYPPHGAMKQDTSAKAWPLSSDEQKAQLKRMGLVEKQLKKDGFKISHSEEGGWIVYRQEAGKLGKGRR